MTRSGTANGLIILGVFTSIAFVRAAVGDTYPPRYTVTVLDYLEGGNTKAHAINDDGIIAGESGAQGSLGYHAITSDNGGPVEQIGASEYTRSAGMAINAAGQVAGRGDPVGGPLGSSIVRYTPGTGMEILGHLGGYSGTVSDINTGGDVIGWWRISIVGLQEDAFLYTDEGGLINLGALGTYSSFARDINDSRQIVGKSYLDSAFSYRAFLWEDSVMQDVGTLGGNGSNAYYINTSLVQPP